MNTALWDLTLNRYPLHHKEHPGYTCLKSSKKKKKKRNMFNNKVLIGVGRFNFWRSVWLSSSSRTIPVFWTGVKGLSFISCLWLHFRFSQMSFHSFISSGPLRLSGISVWIDASYSQTLSRVVLGPCKGKKSEKYISLEEYLMKYLIHKTSWKKKLFWYDDPALSTIK